MGAAAPALGIGVVHAFVQIDPTGKHGAFAAVMTLIGVTHRIALWRCVPLYQATKRFTQPVADARSAKGSPGYAGVCVGWHVAERESADVAAALITRTCSERNVDSRGLVLRSDNRRAMRGSTMISTLQWLDVIPSVTT